MSITLAPSIKSTLCFLLITYIAVQLSRLYRNVLKARKTGLPYIVIPLLETQILAQLATPLFRAAYTKQLDKGQSWPRWCKFMIKDWSWEDKRLAHEQYGDVFVCVSFEGLICYIADAPLSWDVMNRRNDFTKPRDKYKILEPYGPNIVTAEGAEYKFHKRITGPAFADSTGVNRTVWKETMRQTRMLMQEWEERPPQDLHEDVNALTLAVISLAGFGKKLQSVPDQANDVPEGYKISFLHALGDTATFIFPILAFPKWLLRISPWARAELAHSQLEKYLCQMIRNEREDLDNGSPEALEGRRTNLLHLVMRSSYEDGQKTDLNGSTKSSKKHSFTEEEVMGNIFIYLLAGYETTANSISYGLLALAVDPVLQQNLTETIDKVWDNATFHDREELNYKDDFPELHYLYGFMYETFRLYPGVTLITKVCHQSQAVKFENASHILPPDCRVYLSAPAIHYHEKYWEDPMELRPERWTKAFSVHASDDVAKVTDAGKKGKAAAVTADKTRQMRGTLLTFSDGARGCLGRKFAQAEYMAFFASLLRQYQVRLPDGIDIEQAKRDLNLKCAGRVTLAPLKSFRLILERRSEGN